MFFAGDLGQRIFQQPFSWKGLDVDVRGRSRTLHVNYRTSHQIRSRADRLLGPEVTDVDGNTESRRGTVSVFNGLPPTIRSFASAADEITAVAQWLADCSAAGITPAEIGVFVRSDSELDRAHQAVAKSKLPSHVPQQPSEWFSWLAELPQVELLELLALCSALTLNAMPNQGDPRELHVIATAVGLDMADWWEPTADGYLSHVSKAQIVQALKEAGADPGDDGVGDMKKDVLVVKAASRLAGKRWLPSMLRPRSAPEH